MIASDSISPHAGWWELAVIADLVQPTFQRTNLLIKIRQKKQSLFYTKE